MEQLPNFKKLPVEDLIASFADKTQEQSILDRAFTEFHERFAKYVFSVCINTTAVKSIFYQSEIDIIAYNSLLRAYFGAITFTATDAGVSEKGKHKRVCGWLATITRHEVLKYLLRDKKLKEKTVLTDTIDDYIDIVNLIPDEGEENSFVSPQMSLLEEALSRISERDRDITLTYLTFEDEYGKIDPDILTRLLNKYNLLPKYPCKIKNRTIDKLLLLNPFNRNKHTYGIKTEKSKRKDRGSIKRLPPLDGPDVSGNTGTG